MSHLAFAQCKSSGTQSGLLIFDKNLKGTPGSTSLVTASTVPAIYMPFLITSGLFRLTSVILLYRKISGRLKFRTLKNFGRLKISDGFIFGHFFLSEIKTEIFRK